MRHMLIVGGAFVLGLVVWTAHPSEGGAKAERPTRRSLEIREASLASNALIRQDEERVVSQNPVPGASGGTEPKAASPDVRHARMQAQTVGMMQRELGLSADQTSQIAGVFRDRQRDIDAYHREVRALGVFRQGDYDRRIGEIRVAHYARMAAFMDSRQARRFQELVYGGSFGDGIFFDIDPTMVVID